MKVFLASPDRVKGFPVLSSGGSVNVYETFVIPGTEGMSTGSLYISGLWPVISSLTRGHSIFLSIFPRKIHLYSPTFCLRTS